MGLRLQAQSWPKQGQGQPEPAFPPATGWILELAPLTGRQEEPSSNSCPQVWCSPYFLEAEKDRGLPDPSSDDQPSQTPGTAASPRAARGNLCLWVPDRICKSSVAHDHRGLETCPRPFLGTAGGREDRPPPEVGFSPASCPSPFSSHAFAAAIEMVYNPLGGDRVQQSSRADQVAALTFYQTRGEGLASFKGSELE